MLSLRFAINAKQVRHKTRSHSHIHSPAELPLRFAGWHLAIIRLISMKRIEILTARHTQLTHSLQPGGHKSPCSAMRFQLQK